LALKQTRVTAVELTAVGIDIEVAPMTRRPVLLGMSPPREDGSTTIGTDDGDTSTSQKWR